MEKIANLLRSFSDEELALVKKNFLNNPKYPKSSQLINSVFEMLESGNQAITTDDQDAAHGSSYSHLKRRLKEGIIDIIYNAELYGQLGDTISSEKAKCYKYLAISSMLIEKGFAEESSYYLNLAGKIVNERHFSAEKLLYNLLLIEVSNNGNSVKILPKKLKNDLAEVNNLIKSKLDYYKIDKREGTDSDKNECSIPDNNPMVVYYNLFAEVNFCLEMAFFETATSYSYRLIHLIEQNRKCFNRNETIKAKFIHARCLLFNNDLNSATLVFNEIETLKINHIDDKINLAILKWLMAFFTSDLNKTKRYIDDLNLLNSQKHDFGPLIKYFVMCLLFQQKKYKAIQDLMLSESAFQSPKNPFLFAFKTLDIYCLIEMNKNELAYSKALAFKQYLKRSESINKIRYQFILKILIRLIKNNFQYNQIGNYYKNLKESSENNDIRFMPDFNHYELITLEDWLNNRHIEVENYPKLMIAE